MKKAVVGSVMAVLIFSSWSLAVAQQYSYGVYDYAYVDPNTGGVMDYGSDDTTYYDDPAYYDDSAYYDDPAYYDDSAYYDDTNYPKDGVDIADATTTTNKPIIFNPNVIKAINEQVKDDKKAVDEEKIKKDLLEEINKKKQEDDAKPGFGSKVQGMFSEYWVQLLALVVSVIGVVLAVSGFSIANKSKQKNLKKFLHEIDDAYTSYKWKTKRCEAELYRLLDQVEEQLKEGKIDESTFSLLEKRIHKYLDEIKYAEERPIYSDSEQKKNGEKLAKEIDEAVEGKD